MTTVANFNRANLKNIRSDMDKALEEVSKKYGITLGIGSIRFTENDFTCRITSVVKTAGGTNTTDDSDTKVNPKWTVAFLKNYFWMGLKKDDLGKTFKLRGETVKLVGARVKATYPLVVEKANGKFMAVSKEEVIAALAA